MLALKSMTRAIANLVVLEIVRMYLWRFLIHSDGPSVRQICTHAMLLETESRAVVAIWVTWPMKLMIVCSAVPQQVLQHHLQCRKNVLLPWQLEQWVACLRHLQPWQWQALLVRASPVAHLQRCGRAAWPESLVGPSLPVYKALQWVVLAQLALCRCQVLQLLAPLLSVRV